MRAFAAVCTALIWLLLILLTPVQVLAAIGIAAPNGAAAAILGAALILMWIGTVLFFALRRVPLFGWIGVGLAAVLFITATVLIGNHIGAGSSLTAFDVVVRHASPALIPLLMLGVNAGRRAAERQAIIAAIRRGEPAPATRRTVTGRTVHTQNVSVYDRSPDAHGDTPPDGTR